MSRGSAPPDTGFDLRIRLDSRNGWIAGIWAGIARALKTDPAFVRTAVAVIALFFPKLTIAAYLIAWVLLDTEEDSDSDRRTDSRTRNRYGRY